MSGKILSSVVDLNRRQLLGGCAAALLLGVVPSALAVPAASVLAVRVWPSHAYTRVTIESSTPLAFNHFAVKDPERLVVDMEGVDLNGELQSLSTKIGDGDPFIQKLRAGRNKPGVVRLVMELKNEVRPQVFELPPVGN